MRRPVGYLPTCLFCVDTSFVWCRFSSAWRISRDVSHGADAGPAMSSRNSRTVSEAPPSVGLAGAGRAGAPLPRARSVLASPARTRAWWAPASGFPPGKPQEGAVSPWAPVFVAAPFHSWSGCPQLSSLAPLGSMAASRSGSVAGLKPPPLAPSCVISSPVFLLLGATFPGWSRVCSLSVDLGLGAGRRVGHPRLVVPGPSWWHRAGLSSGLRGGLRRERPLSWGELPVLTLPVPGASGDLPARPLPSSRTREVYPLFLLISRFLCFVLRKTFLSTARYCDVPLCSLKKKAKL